MGLVVTEPDEGGRLCLWESVCLGYWCVGLVSRFHLVPACLAWLEVSGVWQETLNSSFVYVDLQGWGSM